MTDLVFLLLIFFIIMSTKVEPHIDVDLPKSSDTPPSQTTSCVMVQVTPDSRYRIDDGATVYSFEEVKGVLDQKMRGCAETTVKVAGDREANYEAVFMVIAMAKEREWKPVLAFTP